MDQFAAIRLAVQIHGGEAQLAHALGISRQAVHGWVHGDRRIPAERCPQIERLTAGLVRAEELRPDVEWDVLRT